MKLQHYCLEGILHQAKCGCRCAPCVAHTQAYNCELVSEQIAKRQAEFELEFKKNMIKNSDQIRTKRDYMAPTCNSTDPNCRCFVCRASSLNVTRMPARGRR